MDKPTNWKEVCNVEWTNNRVLNNPYLSTTPAVQTSQTRGSAYTYQDFGETNESITISTFEALPIFIDRADLAQSTFSKQMYFADLQGTLINERLEAAMLASHADWTNFGDTGGGALGLASTAFTVSATNIDDVIRGVKREIIVANGMTLAARHGIFIIWRPADFELLEAFVQANGFSTADLALKDGTVTGMRYMGVDHYVSNSHTAGHLFAGVKKQYHLGILKDTYGQVVLIQDPAKISGVGVVARLDYAFKAWNNSKTTLFDLNVN